MGKAVVIPANLKKTSINANFFYSKISSIQVSNPIRKISGSG